MSPVETVTAIGSMPHHRDRSMFIARLTSSDNDERRYYSLLTSDANITQAPTVDDIKWLSLDKSLDFLRGIDAVYSSRLRKSRDCVCNMPPAVVLPVAVYALMIRRDFKFAQLHWKDFASIPRSCAERLVSETYFDMRSLTFGQFAARLLGEQYDHAAPFNVDHATILAGRMERAYSISQLTGR